MKFEVSYKRFDKEEGEYKVSTKICEKELTCGQKEIYNSVTDSTPPFVFFMTVTFGIIAGSMGLIFYCVLAENPNIFHFLVGELITFISTVFVSLCLYLDYRTAVKKWKKIEKGIIDSIQKELRDEQKKIAEEYYKEHPEKFMAIYKLKED